MPARSATSREERLSPSAAMASGEGPMKRSPAAAQALANDGLCERKP